MTINNTSKHYQARQSLPTDKIWCSRCGLFKQVEAFAKNRKTQAMNLMQKGFRLGDDKITDRLICIQCVGGPVVELECQGECGKKRALSDFSANQRSNPDDALCISCLAKKMNVRPGPQHLHENVDDDERKSVQGSTNTTTRASTLDGGVSLMGPSVLATNQGQLTKSRVGMTGSSVSALSDESKLVKAPPVETKNGWAKVKSGFREEPVPVFADDDVDLADDDDGQWEM